MSGFENIKPSYDEWMYWAQVVIDRLTTISHVYSQPPHPDVFIREKERQEKLSMTAEVMRHLHELTDEFDMRLPRDAEEATLMEDALITSLQPVFQDILERLPAWSTDMQRLLKSPWASTCAGRLATILFRGPDGRENEGIGSGMIENGRLPAQLAEMMDREVAGGDRAPRVQKPKHVDVHMRREDLARLWAKQNSAFMRTAGRVD